MKMQKQLKLMGTVGFLAAAVFLSGCGKSSQNSQSNSAANQGIVDKVKEAIPQKSDEDKIKDLLKSYYSTLGDRKFGDAYKYVATTSNASVKDYVDAMSQKGIFITGFNDISYNYIQISGDAADASATINWKQMNNPIASGDTYKQDASTKVVKENGDWKILWEKPTNTE